MYGELHQSLTEGQRDEYLKFIGMEAPQKADLEYLDRLVFAHQCTVPFENLNPMAARPVELGTEALFNKIIKGGRGGFCFELNGLFCRLLEACGYDAYGCRARVVRDKDFIPPCLHRGTLVRLDDGLYYVDVGYGGPQPGGALKVEDGFERTVCGQTFRVTEYDSDWWMFSKESGGRFAGIIQFTLMKEDESEYLPGCYYCATNRDSVFVQKYMLNRRLKDGSVSVVGDSYKRITDGVRIEKKIAAPGMLAEIAETEFGIRGAGRLICRDQEGV